jgi:hypothetical protein
VAEADSRILHRISNLNTVTPSGSKSGKQAVASLIQELENRRQQRLKNLDKFGLVKSDQNLNFLRNGRNQR